jgi:hypothetical protein
MRLIVSDRKQRLVLVVRRGILPLGIEADMPAVWAGSEQPNRHAVGMPSRLSAIFIEQISELFLGSGPRGRRFKSSRPDQLFPKTLGILVLMAPHDCS